MSYKYVTYKYQGRQVLNEKTEKEDKSSLEIFADKVYKYAKNNFNNFITIMTLICMLLGWIIKLCWYFYRMGKLSYYGISNTNLVANNENIIVEVVIMFATGVIMFSTNLVAYRIHDEDKILIVKFFKILGLWGVGIILLSAVNCVLISMKMITFGRVFWEANAGEKVEYLSTVLATETIFFAIGISTYYVKKWGERMMKIKEKKKNNKKKKETPNLEQTDSIWKIILKMIFVFLVVIAIEFGVFYLQGKESESIKTDYKVIVEKVMSENQREVENKFEIYAVVYENKQQYVLVEILDEKDEISGVHQKIVDKKNVDTYQIENIKQKSRKQILEKCKITDI